MTSPPSALREDADVETSSDGYARRFAGPVGVWFLEVQARSTVRLLRNLPAGARLLDVGGGHAQLTPALLAAGYDVTVAGSHPVCAARLEPWLGERCRFVTADLLDLPYPDRAFDGVVCFRLLPHSVDWRRLVGELCRVAARSVLVDYPSRRSVNIIADQLFLVKKAVEQNTRPFLLFSPEEIRLRFAEAGFDVGSSDPQFVAPMVLYRLSGMVGPARVLETAAALLGLRKAFGSPVIVRADRRQLNGG